MYCIISYFIISYCMSFYYVVLHCVLLCCIILYCIVLYYTVLYCIVLYNVIYWILHYIYCIVILYTAILNHIVYYSIYYVYCIICVYDFLRPVGASIALSFAEQTIFSGLLWIAKFDTPSCILPTMFVFAYPSHIIPDNAIETSQSLVCQDWYGCRSCLQVQIVTYVLCPEGATWWTPPPCANVWSSRTGQESNDI